MDELKSLKAPSDPYSSCQTQTRKRVHCARRFLHPQSLLSPCELFLLLDGLAMSAFRNAIKRRAHRERAQTYDRQKFGLLEKKKDYKLRAKDYHRKQDAIRVLREKAAMRNPDEFYFKMNTTQSKDGVHIGATIGKQHTARELKRFKKQDAGNIQLRVAQEQKRIDALQAELHGLDERDEKNHPATIHRIFSSRQELKHHMKPSRSDSSSTSSSTDSESSVPELSVKVQRKRKARYAELEDRKNRKR